MNIVNLRTKPNPGVTGRAIDEAFNNDLAMAYAAGDPRFNAKQYDRPGLSRAGAQWNQAGIDSANKMAEGVAGAYSSRMANVMANAGYGLGAAAGQQQFGQALGGLAQQNVYQQAMDRLQRQQTGLGILRGLMP
ncbi:MAG: hypothetical protein EBT03_07235 [Betaproteobacteria bacterium]|jgi:hypothetical protein|nr:hypothetical protein [Betaproteobacteria bacterium]NCA17587.1 hypothetical protein [Betaproteobacteria bacterium]